MEIGLSLRVDIGTEDGLGHGKARLLELIADQGSIAGAARAMGMSYRRAWLLVDHLNHRFSGPLVASLAGGAGGGGATLTDLGARVLALYRRMEARAREATREERDELKGLIAPSGSAAPSGSPMPGARGVLPRRGRSPSP